MKPKAEHGARDTNFDIDKFTAIFTDVYQIYIAHGQ